MKPPITAVVPTLDEQHNIGPCLSALDWLDEIVVVDSHSRDNTCALARKAGARVLLHRFEGYGAQKNWAAAQARNDWILQVDADERITCELRDEILRLFRQAPEHQAYSIPRRSLFAGRLIRHGGWQRDRVARLYHRQRAHFSDRLVHEKLLANGSTGKLRSPMMHHTYRDLSHFLDKTARYAEAGARQLLREGHRPRPRYLVTAPLGRFVRMYVLQAGFLDGTEGFLLATIAAWGVFQRYALLRELAGAADCVEPGALPSFGTKTGSPETDPSGGESWR
jgi:glycosyltransferase involved in cell wall biosynthesis